jgi:hypothetical protein
MLFYLRLEGLARDKLSGFVDPVVAKKIKFCECIFRVLIHNTSFSS